MRQSYKVGYIFFNSLWEGLPDEVTFKLDENINFLRKCPDIDETIWKKWLGLQWDEIKESNAVVEVKFPTNTPEVLDNENAEIELLCRKIWVSFMLTDSFHLDDAYFLTGSEVDSKVGIRSYFKLDRWFHSNEHAVKMNNVHLGKWSSLCHKLKDIYARKDEFLRLKRGTHCFLKACNESNINFRFPYYVRSLEALIIPSKGKTTEQFISRVGKFWKLCETDKAFIGEDAQKVLQEIYEIRCDFDHMHGMKLELKERQMLRCFQCEELCRRSYQKVLLNDSLLNNFVQDEHITEIWKDNNLLKFFN